MVTFLDMSEFKLYLFYANYKTSKYNLYKSSLLAPMFEFV